VNFKICKGFKENLYEVRYFSGLCEYKMVNLKSSWVFKTIAKNNRRWSPKAFQKFLDTLPYCYQIPSTDLYNSYIQLAKSNFVEALYFYTQENAAIESMTGRDTSNTSSNIGVELFNLRLEKILSNSSLGELYDSDNHHVKKFKKTEKYLDEEENFSWEKYSLAKSKLMSYFTADKDFTFKMMLLLGTLRADKNTDRFEYGQIRDVSSQYSDIDYKTAVLRGESLFFEQFLDGVEEKYVNEAFSNNRKTKNALDLLKTDSYKYTFNEKYRTPFENFDRFSDIFTDSENYDKQKKIIMVLPGHKVGVSSMIGASKLISKYEKFFNSKDIKSLKKRKSFYGRKIQLTCKKEFMLSSDDMDKYSHMIDKNDKNFPLEDI